MAGGLGGLGGFGNVLQALGQSLLTSPSGNPFETLPQHMQAVQQQREHAASLGAMSAVAEKLGIPKEIAANPVAMSLLIQQMNTTQLNKLRQQAAAGGSLMPSGDDTTLPDMSVPPPAAGAGGLGGLGGATSIPRPPSFTQAGGRAGASMSLPVDPALAPAIAKYATAAGLDPVDVATAMSYETGGTFDKWQRGPVTKWGQHRGLIQWGQPQARQYGVTQDTPIEDQVKAAIKYLQDRGVKPGMGLMDIYSAINAGGVGRYNARDAAAGGAPGTVADKVNNQMGAHRRKAEALLASAQPSTAGNVPLPPPRPTQLAQLGSTIPGGVTSMGGYGVPASPNLPAPTRPTGPLGSSIPAGSSGTAGMADYTSVPPPSPAMQRVIEEARAKGVGQTEPAPYQVASSGRTIPVPIPQTSIPATPAPPVPAGENKTRAMARQEFQRGMNILATSNGDPVLMKQAELIIQRATKYLDPSEAAKRVSEAGLQGTPLGRGIVAGLDPSVLQALSEQQIPGYEAPATRERQRMQLEERKYGSALDQQAWQRVETETARRERTRLAEEARREQTRLAEMTAAEKEGRAAMRAPDVVEAGRAAKVAEIGAETTARSTATALTSEAVAATNAGRMAQRLMPALSQAKEAFNKLKEAGTGQFGGIGPSANSPASRAIAARMPEWTPAFQNEVNRQRFDSAMAAIRSAKTAVDLKGQGPVSNFERTLAGADLPDPASVSAKVVEDAFDRLEKQLNAALALDRKLGLHGGEQPAAAPAAADGGWVDMGGGVRVRRK